MTLEQVFVFWMYFLSMNVVTSTCNIPQKQIEKRVVPPLTLHASSLITTIFCLSSSFVFFIILISTGLDKAWNVNWKTGLSASVSGAWMGRFGRHSQRHEWPRLAAYVGDSAGFCCYTAQRAKVANRRRAVIAPGDAVHLDAAGLTVTFQNCRIRLQNVRRLRGTLNVRGDHLSNRRAASLSEYSGENEIGVTLGNCRWVAIVGTPCCHLQCVKKL